MSNSVVSFSNRLDFVLTEDSLIEDNVFDSFTWNSSGGDVYVSDGIKLAISGCKFSNCVADMNGGGLCVETELSNTTRTFLSCGCKYSGFIQHGNSKNLFEYGLLFPVVAIFGWSVLLRSLSNVWSI